MNYKLINFFFDNSVNRACFYSNDWWIFSLEKTTCCLSSYLVRRITSACSLSCFPSNMISVAFKSL